MKQEEAQGVDPSNVQRKGRTPGPGGQDSDFDVRGHAFRPPRFRKSQKSRCAEPEEDGDDNFDDDDDISPGTNAGDRNVNHTSDSSPCGRGQNDESHDSPVEMNRSGNRSGHLKSEERINARIDDLARYST